MLTHWGPQSFKFISLTEYTCNMIKFSPRFPWTISRVEFMWWPGPSQWRHNERDNVSNHWRLGCLLNRLFRQRSKKTSKLCVIGFCEGDAPMTSGLSSRGKFSIWWRHHDKIGATTDRSDPNPKMFALTEELEDHWESAFELSNLKPLLYYQVWMKYTTLNIRVSYFVEFQRAPLKFLKHNFPMH